MKISKTTKKAEWKKVEGVDHNVYHCENCGLLWYMSNEGTPKQNEMNFCPKCGFIIKTEE